MKKIILILALFVTSNVSNAQEQPAQMRTHYDATSLLFKGKLELTTIYLQQVETLNNLLPYAAFPIKGQASGIKTIDIPNSKYTSKKRESLAKITARMNEDTKESMNEIIPYADKIDIVRGIIFVQEMIERLDAGLAK